MTRLINTILALALCVCVYATFSIKKDVAVLANKVAILKNNLRGEQEKIDLYHAELAVLTGASHIDQLTHRLLPALKIVTAHQMNQMDHTQPMQFAQTNLH